MIQMTRPVFMLSAGLGSVLDNRGLRQLYCSSRNLFGRTGRLPELPFASVVCGAVSERAQSDAVDRGAEAAVDASLHSR